MGFQFRTATFLMLEEIIAIVVFRFKKTALLVVVVSADSAETHALFALLGNGVVIVVIL